MDHLSKDVDSGRIQMSLENSMAEVENLQARSKTLAEQIAEERAKNDAELRKISFLKAEVNLLDQEAEMLTTHITSEEQRNKWYEESVIPQLRNEAEVKEEIVKSKQEQHRKTLEHYENIWKKYEIQYNKFPRVAERNALKERLDSMRAELVNKRQEVHEKQVQAKTIQEKKAYRLEQLYEEYLEWQKIEQDEKARNYELLLQNRELEERIAAKEAQILSQAPVPVVEPEQTPLVVPFKIPILDLSLLDAFKNAASKSFEGPITKQTQGTDLRVPQVTSLPAKPYYTPAVQVAISPAPASCSENFAQLVHTSMAQETASSEILKSPHVVGRPVSGSGKKKKEVILSTDNIAAKMKESVPQFPPIEKSKTLSATPKIVTCTLSQDSSINQDCTESHSDIDKYTEVQEEPSLLPAECETDGNENNPSGEEVERLNSGDMFADDDSEEPSEPNLTEFRDDMYDSLPSPPPFDVVMSPAHANFSSPSSFEEENQTDQQGGAISTSSFGGFGFFSSAKSSTNVFGGPSGSKDDQKDEDKPSSSFPFFF